MPGHWENLLCVRGTCGSTQYCKHDHASKSCFNFFMYKILILITTAMFAYPAIGEMRKQ